MLTSNKALRQWAKKVLRVETAEHLPTAGSEAALTAQCLLAEIALKKPFDSQAPCVWDVVWDVVFVFLASKHQNGQLTSVGCARFDSRETFTASPSEWYERVRLFNFDLVPDAGVATVAVSTEQLACELDN